MKPYSQDLRDRIIAALEAGEDTHAAIALTFSVSRTFVEKLWRQWGTTGSSAPKAHGGGQARKLKAAADMIQRAVTRQPDLVLHELCAEVEVGLGIHASVSMMCRELQRLHLPRKKRRYMRVSKTLRVFRPHVRSIDSGR